MSYAEERRICAASYASEFDSDDIVAINEVIETSVDEECSLQTPSLKPQALADDEARPSTNNFLFFRDQWCPRQDIPQPLLEFRDMFEGDGSQTPEINTQWIDARIERDRLRLESKAVAGRVGIDMLQDMPPVRSAVRVAT